MTHAQPISPPRLLFGRGCRGGIVRSIQERLAAGGYYTGIIDGVYGGGTERGVSECQRRIRLPATGSVDDTTWRALMSEAIPTVFERALQLTAAFEGHGFGAVEGNWDGAWLTWGIVGFTLRDGEIAKILLGVEKTDPNLLGDAFGKQTARLLEVLRAGPATQETWANSISEGTSVKDPWRSGFERLGNQMVVQTRQLERARSAYFVPALRTAAAFHLTSERGLALAFDIHVQNGGIDSAARAAILAQPTDDEPARRVIIASAVADAAKPQFRDDVRARKLTIATGEGAVHGETFKIACWGLAE